MEILRACVLGAASIVVVGASARSATVFVNAGLTTGANDGSSWANAFRGRLGLIPALASAREGDEVWVAAGVYAPASAGGDRELSFDLPAGVVLLGGFNGTESRSDQRNPAAHVVRLTGDLNGNDGPPATGIPANSSDNAHHVVRFAGPGAATIDGVVIRDGAADSFADQRRGAGVFITGGALALRDCRLGPSWSSWHGGGVSVENGTIIVDRCTLTGMRANMGGAVSVLTGATAMITDSSFVDNIGGLGCAVFVGPTQFNGPIGGAISLERCRFEGGNGVVGSASGGGLYLLRATQAEVIDCAFIDNAVAGGGGAAFIAECDASFDRCHFVRNEAPGDGGGAIYVIGTLTFGDEGFAHARFANSRLVGNNGASLSIAGGVAQYINCTFANNSLGDEFLTWPVFFTSFQNGTTICQNTVIWDNAASPVTFGGPIFGGSIGGKNGTLELERCIVQQWSNQIPGADVIDADPLFVDTEGADNIRGTEDDNLRLGRGSPAIDAGDAAFLEPRFALDLDMLPRVVDDPCAIDRVGGLDLGAYERQVSGACVADLTCDGVVNVDDLNAVLADWGTEFDVEDLNAVLSHWQSTCE